MTKEENLKELIFSQFDKEIEGSDIYEHAGSKWIIFTDSRKWVVEFTKDKTLWFNYHHFNSILVLFAMDSTFNKDIIKEWYENKFIFKPDIKKVNGEFGFLPKWIDNVVENGVRSTRGVDQLFSSSVEDTIQNGVKYMISGEFISEDIIEDTIQNGVNVISWVHPTANHSNQVDDIIQNGVKHISGVVGNAIFTVEDTIQNGVKHIQAFHSDLYPLVEGTITKGVKC